MDCLAELLEWIHENTETLQPNPWTDIKYVEVDRLINVINSLKEWRKEKIPKPLLRLWVREPDFKLISRPPD